ncbi:MAG TPA: hypothetical protein VKA26_06585 [Ignavibacteriaceae bacterium]|nr:hypothetical protein [Ignavibacteriaceae bacterium]
MATIALIGADGSGKTTISKMLLDSPPAKMKYLYMGLNIESSNYALPTSRLIYYFKLVKYKKRNKNLKNVKLKNLSLHELNDNRNLDTRGKLAATARMINRIAEAFYRQAISWIFQLRGYTVLYDRHFIFELPKNQTKKELKGQRFTWKIYVWLVNKIISEPELVFLLYAPPEVLFERKKEADIDYLKKRNENYMKVGSGFKNFYVIDATQPIDIVFADVFGKTSHFLNKNKLIN